MAAVTPELKQMYRDYVSDAPGAAGNLSFLLENLGYSVSLDGSRESFVELEKIYWELNEKGIPADLSDLDHFAQLMGQYLGATIVEQMGAKWVQCTDQNPTNGQPCVDGFGNKKWDRIFPASLANNLPDLKSQSPSFPGVRDRTVFASQLDKATKLSGK